MVDGSASADSVDGTAVFAPAPKTEPTAPTPMITARPMKTSEMTPLTVEDLIGTTTSSATEGSGVARVCDADRKGCL